MLVPPRPADMARLAPPNRAPYHSDMILLPLPIVLAMIFGFLALRMAIAQRPVPLLAILLAMLAG